MAKSRINTADMISADAKGILADWLVELRALGEDSRINNAEVHSQASDFLKLISKASKKTSIPRVPRGEASASSSRGSRNHVLSRDCLSRKPQPSSCP